jgi:2-dehydro-3-deoxyphosphogluconate aldolase / (4S)-4-hydroxy-2-oxoglutarate aldolase
MVNDPVGRPELPRAARSGRLIAILRGLPTDRLVAQATSICGGGLRCLEVTPNSPDALRSIALLRTSLPEATIGAGTVLDVDAAALAVDAGAEFLVTPHVDERLLAWAARRGVPTLAGALTATEVLTAWRAGASAVKLFPAGVLGSEYLAQLRAPFPDIPMVATGGVTLQNAGAFIAAGAAAVGVGSELTSISPAEAHARAQAIRARVSAAAQ